METHIKIPRGYEEASIGMSCAVQGVYYPVEWLELDMEQQSGSKQEKEYIKAVNRHPAYLTSVQSTS